MFENWTDEELEADDRRRQAARFRTVERCAAYSGHALAIMTCRGREALYAKTMSSLGVNTNMVHWPGPTMTFRDHAREGQARTFFRVLRWAAAIPGLSYLTVFEDDIAVARNALDYIAMTKIDDDLVLASWFHRYIPQPYSSDVRWMIEKAEFFSHAQAMTIPARTIRRLLASDVVKNWSEPHGADMVFSMVMPDEPVAYHFPNLVDHVAGEASLTGNVGARSSLTFVGEDFDALSLIPIT